MSCACHGLLDILSAILREGSSRHGCHDRRFVAFTSCSGLAAGRMRPGCAGAARRRRARRLPGGRLPGAARSRDRAGLGSGVSIGAINSAIIAGNSRKRRLGRLREFWELITERKVWSYTPDGDLFRKARNTASSWMTMVQGQPGFFSPRHAEPVAQPRGSPECDELTTIPGRCATRWKTSSIFAHQRKDRSFLGRRGQRAQRQFRLFR